MGVLGVAFAGGLYYAAKKMHVETDERIELLSNILPGSNCGACGFSGCSGMARALLDGTALPGGCPPGGTAVAQRVAELLGVQAVQGERKVAQVACGGNTTFAPRADYDGLTDCRAANLVAGGQKSCVYGCLGLGTCVSACQFGALTQDERGVPVVDIAACVGCGKCAEVCPRDLIKMVEAGNYAFVHCNAPVDGRTVRSMCSEGCIACRACERTCQYDAIHVVDNVARVDPAKCTGCGECAAKCPTKCIGMAGKAFVVASTA